MIAAAGAAGPERVAMEKVIALKLQRRRALHQGERFKA